MNRLSRLFLILALTTAVGFGGWAAYSHWRLQSAKALGYQLIKDRSKLTSECFDPSASEAEKLLSCRKEALVEEQLDRTIASVADLAEKRNHAAALVGVAPAGLLLLFVAGRWVWTGRLRRPQSH